MDDEIVFDGKDLKAVGLKLREAALLYEKEMGPTLAAIGEEVKTAAKAIAGQHSRSTPPTIHVRPAPGAVVIAAGGPEAPIAALDELGNKGSRRTATTFRHPVYGNRNVSVEQEKHPFLRPALHLSRRAITQRLEKAWERVLLMIEAGV